MTLDIFNYILSHHFFCLSERVLILVGLCAALIKIMKVYVNCRMKLNTKAK